MASNTTRKPRNWLLTILCVPPVALFLYIGIGVWFVEPESPVNGELYVKLAISALCLVGVFMLMRVIVRGHTNANLKEIVSDFLASM